MARRVLLGVVIALALAGCGTTTTVTRTTTASSTTRAASAPSKGAFVAQVDAICHQVDAEIEPLRSELNTMTDLSKGAALINTAVGEEQAALARMQALPEPAGSGPVLTKLWQAIGAEITDLQNAAQAASEGNLEDLQAASTAGQTAQAFYRGIAQGYGFKSCGRAN